MHFIIVYDRPKMSRIAFESFADTAKGIAISRKLQFEQEYANREDVEVAFFESASEAMLRRTHSRYFNSIEELAANVAGKA